MEYNKPLGDLLPGDETEGFYLLKNASARTTAAGKPFLNMTLTDQSGSVESVVWDYAGPVGPANEGSAVKIRGRVSEYRGALQLVVDRIRAAGEGDDVDVSALVPTAPIDGDAAWNYVLEMLQSMEDRDYATVAETLLRRHETEMRRIPAAKSVHHSFLGGLLMHTANMLQTADFLAAQYAETIDRSLLLAGTVLHDLAKIKEFSFSPLGLVTDYATKGQLLGHLVMGAQEVAEVSKELGISEEKSVLLQHMILSHHGEPEFGAAVRPLCAESELLSLIDMIDSRMEIYRTALEEVPVGEFSGRIFALEKKIYHHS